MVVNRIHFAGVHQVEVEYCSVAVNGSPFLANVYNPNGIQVTSVNDGMIGKKSFFHGKYEVFVIYLCSPSNILI